MELKKALEILESHDNFIILTHRRPDGDTIGSAVALCLGLRQLHKTAYLYKNPQFTERFAPILTGLCTDSIPESATVVATDVASDQLICFGCKQLSGKIALAVDHHASHTLSAEHHLVKPECAACGEIIYEMLLSLGVKVDAAIADALYIAVSTDTGCFKYANTTASTLRIAADLLDCGANTARINKIFFDTKSLSRLMLEARLTTTMEFYADGTVAICKMPQKWLTELSIDEDAVDSISGFARAVEGVKIGIMIREIEGGAGRISVRTGPEYDACAICSKLGGGGHAAAAGCTVDGGIEKAKDAILTVLRERGISL